MKTRFLITALLLVTNLHAADLPTVSIEHLYYLQARADRVRKYKPDEMIEYCIAQKMGGPGFDYIYSQVVNFRLEITKMIEIQEVQGTDPRIVSLNKSIDAYTRVLREEAQKIQGGVVREGQIAGDALEAIGRAQTAR